MRLIVGLMALFAALPLAAQDVAVASAVYVERQDGNGARHVEPATHLRRGDRIVTILRWDAPANGRYTAVSAVPPRLALESASGVLEVSTDGGRNWRSLGDGDGLPAGVTHLRWQVSGEGRVSYRAVVR